MLPLDIENGLSQSYDNNFDYKSNYKKEYYKPSTIEITDVLMQSNQKFSVLDGILYSYDEPYNYWFPIRGKEGDVFLRKLINPIFRPHINKNLVEEVTLSLQSYYDIPVISLINLKAQRNYLNFKNGVYDISSSTFHENMKSPYLYFRSYINADYYDDECLLDDNEAFNHYLKTTFNCNEDRKVLAEIIGLCLSNIRNLKYFIFCYGNHNSGKSVLFNIIDGLIGSKFTASVPFSNLGDRFCTALLYGKSVNLGSEVNELTSRKIDYIKLATGNDKMLYEQKREDPFIGLNSTLLLFACNHFPKLSAIESIPLFSRLQMLEFPNSFERNEWINDLTETILENPQPIIHFAIEGLQRFINNGYDFSQSKNCNRLMKSFIQEANSFIAFARKYIVINKNSVVSSSSIKEKYTDYCMDKDLEPVDVKIWSKILQREYNAKTIRNTKEGFDVYNERSYKGIKLKEKD